ncbi:hypothetical protein K402DRAFT_21185 [Aulographum hederae CBS 113979]|uniref:Uncharacterized protein n=1 Tax=Aulographum hederae CBS 113979 TaxID=1176131 RepID=A0A6G1H7A8_9PEZI|nr:hypothetical protein K402DRAFT_21185 [Aulographum hederae CBS 113979]
MSSSMDDPKPPLPSEPSSTGPESGWDSSYILIILYFALVWLFGFGIYLYERRRTAKNRAQLDADATRSRPGHETLG